MNIITQKKLTIIGAVAVLLSLLPRPAMAVLGESDILNVFDPTLPPTLQFQVLSVTEQMEALAPNMLWTLLTPGDPTQFGNAIAFTEPGSSSIISDIVGVAKVNGQFVLAFMSDDNNHLDLALATTYFGRWTTIPEPEDEYDVTRYLHPLLQGAGASAGFQSDIEVPEPTTLVAGALLLVPFGMSTMRVLRKKQTV
jgi:hypothetical protein